MKNLSFTQVKTIPDLFSIIYQESQLLHLLSLDIFQHHLQSLLCLQDELQQDFLQFVHYVDDNLSSNYYSFTRQKLAILLSAATYYHDFYDQIKEFSFGELSILANFSAFEPVEVYPDNLEVFSKSILYTIEQKTDNFMRRNDLMSFVSLSFDKGASYVEVLDKLQSQSLVLLSRQANLLQQEIVDGGAMYDSRRV